MQGGREIRGVGGRPSPLRPVGTHDLCVRCVKGYSIVFLTGTDARPCVPTEIGVTAFDEWSCRADVACVGADLRVRPQNRLRSGEDGRTHRSAPTVEVSTPPSGSPEEKSTELAKREKTSHFTCI